MNFAKPKLRKRTIHVDAGIELNGDAERPRQAADMAQAKSVRLFASTFAGAVEASENLTILER